MLFALLFGFSMDYQVFLISRIREEWRSGRVSDSDAVAHGLARTGRIITSAAAIMICVFGAFVLGDLRVLRVIGLGMAVAVLLDATLVRMVATPAVLLLDLSTSMNWGAADEYGPEWPDAGSRRAIVAQALYGLVRVLEREDSEAAAEQADGSDELGGLMAHGFANRHVEIGDLNSSNLERRLNQIKWGGKTYIMPAWLAALADYDEEFGDRDPDEQPTMLTLVVTDGEADDWQEFAPVLEKATVKRVFVVAIVGHGRRHDATLAAYQQAARKNAAQDKFGKAHVEVVFFDAVTDPEEIALDLITLVS